MSTRQSHPSRARSVCGGRVPTKPRTQKDCAAPARKDNASAGNLRRSKLVYLPEGWVRVLRNNEDSRDLPRRMYNTRLGAEVLVNWELRTFSLRFFGRSESELLWRRAATRPPQGRGWRQRLLDLIDHHTKMHISKEDGK